ncbi:RAB6A-GEF complex partner protein 2-like isoform X2 [Acanthaster planci]|uniref:RAB6A-GEF complex partner protein 2-like isoform X2 n=1 Tax=Acanthaster planci TaxID=133434 RepID=A0A8B7ZHV2_ACAPL|nr:RAB6A-GEF complex partner protein 2-like isoform X2 [Acanthaster planci]
MPSQGAVMIEVSAHLTRGLTFLAGEIVECSIAFTCPSNATSSLESLAWASAQLHCQCHISSSKVILPKMPADEKSEELEMLQSSVNTSLAPSRGEKGQCILSTEPKILFCDLKLKPGERKTFLYRETIPSDAPPSYRGQAVKYSYKVTIGMQRVNCPIRLLRVPFRVLVLYGLGDTSLQEQEDQAASSNPFLAEERTKNSLLDLAVQVLNTVTSRKNPNSYNIKNSEGPVARFCLFKPAYKLGEDIIGTIEFPASCTVPCIQYSVVLQSEEHIAEECRRKPHQGVSMSSHGRHQEFCLHMSKSHMVLPIPLHVTPGFITDIVCLKWRLHFEFITAKEPLPDHVIPADQSESALWQGPQSLNVDTLVWNLPIKILPTNPLHASTSTTLLTKTPTAVTV